MTNYILLGGNGYLGRNFIRYAKRQDSTAHFYVISRSGKNQLTDQAISNVKGDISAATSIEGLPKQVDYVVDFIGGPENDPQKLKAENDAPAEWMRQFAEKSHAKAMGFIGGILGPKAFVMTKKRLIKQLQKSSVRLAYVEPTLVYGNGRHDSMTRMVPLLKVAGIFSKRLRPVKVDTVVAQLWKRLVGQDETK